MYTIVKDGLYLSGLHYAGIAYYDGDGRRMSMPTCVFSSSKYDAMQTNDRALAKQIGGEVVEIRFRRKRKIIEAAGNS